MKEVHKSKNKEMLRIQSDPHIKMSTEVNHCISVAATGNWLRNKARIIYLKQENDP